MDMEYIHIQINKGSGSNKAKGHRWQRALMYRKQAFMEGYRKAYPELKYTLTDNEDEATYDQELCVEYDGMAFTNKDEAKNWELYTQSGRPSRVTQKNYHAKIGRKFPAGRPVANEYRTVTFRHPTEWTHPPQFMAQEQGVERHIWESWVEACRRWFKVTLGLACPTELRSSMYKIHYDDRDGNNMTMVSLPTEAIVRAGWYLTSDMSMVRINNDPHGSRSDGADNGQWTYDEGVAVGLLTGDIATDMDIVNGHGHMVVQDAKSSHVA